ncbi:MAG: type III pantothenate kinase [Bacteroidales bacterium]
MDEFVSLCIDIGNTNVKTAVFRGTQMDELLIMPTRTFNDASKLLRKVKANKIHGAILSNVSQQKTELVNQLKAAIPLVIELNFQTPLPIEIKYESPSTLGTDRIAAASAAWHKAGCRPSLAITCGTCIIYDYIDAKGNYLGGAISPGLRQRLKVLHEQSARLPWVEPQDAPAFPGKNTQQSILAGVMRGIIHEIDGFVDELKQSQPNLHVFLSGGDAHYFATQLKNSIFAAPNLIMEGLNQILLFNAKQS